MRHPLHGDREEEEGEEEEEEEEDDENGSDHCEKDAMMTGQVC